MANETTTTTLTEIINSEWINPVLQSYDMEFVNATRFTYKVSLIGKGTSTWAQPRLVSDMGTVGDGGTGVATAFDADFGGGPGEATALTDTTLETEESTVAVNEYGLSREISDTAMEDMIDGVALLQLVAQDGAQILATAREDDLIGLFSSLSNSQTDTGNDIQLSDFRLGVAAIRNRGVRAPGGLVAVLSDTQVSDLEADAEATNSATAVFPGTADGMLRVAPNPDNGFADGRVLTVRGVPVYQSGLVDTVNTGEDDAGAIFVRGDVESNRPWACFGEATGRMFRLETERDARARTTIVVMTERAGYGELKDTAGEQMIFDA